MFKPLFSSASGARCCLSLWAVIVAALAVATPAQAASFVYVPGQAGDQPGNVSQYGVGAGGLLAPLVPPTVSAGVHPQGVVVSPNGDSVYVANKGSVSQYDLGPGGKLQPKSPPTVPAGPLAAMSLAVSPNGDSVYVTTPAPFPMPGTVSQYDVGAGGALQPKSPPTVATDRHPVSVAVSPDGASVYVANNNSDTVSQYDVGAGGALQPKSPPTVAAEHGPGGVAVSPDGASVYVTNAASNTVSQYDVGAGGALTPKSTPTVAAGGAPIVVAVRPNGDSVYVTNPVIGTVSQYDVGAGGLLAPKSPPTVDGDGGEIWGVAVSPGGDSVYVALSQSDAVAQFDVGAGGLLAPKSPFTVATGSFPLMVAVSPDIPNRPPDCSGVHADPATLSPATRDQFKTVTLSGASDPDGDSVSFHIDGVSQDEPVTGSGDDTSPDAQLTAAGANSNQVKVRAERNPMRNGRVYRIAYTVSDGNGHSCSRTAANTNAKVSVPRKNGQTAVDDAPPSYNSFTGAPLP